jgi:hypothetical protein
MMTAILTQPRYALGSQSGEKIIILDTSASMLAETPPSPPRPAGWLSSACDHLKKIPPLRAASF